MKKFILFILFFSFAFSCCCYPGVSCSMVNASTKAMATLAKKELSVNDKIMFSENLKKVNQTFKKINELENEITIYRDKINALKMVQSITLKNINKTLEEINNLKVLLISSLLNYHKSISLNNKILLYELIRNQAKNNYNELKRILKK